MDCMNYNRMDGLRLFIALTAVGSIEDHPRFKRLAEIEEAVLHPCRHKKKVARFEGDDFFAHLKATPARNHHVAFIAAVRLLAILKMRDIELDLQLAADLPTRKRAPSGPGMWGRISPHVSRKASMALIIEHSSWST